MISATYTGTLISTSCCNYATIDGNIRATIIISTTTISTTTNSGSAVFGFRSSGCLDYTTIDSDLTIFFTITTNTGTICFFPFCNQLTGLSCLTIDSETSVTFSHRQTGTCTSTHYVCCEFGTIGKDKVNVATAIHTARFYIIAQNDIPAGF